MLIFENSNLEIHDVGSSTDPTLTPIEVTDGTFDGWSVAKICCYRAQVVDGNVVMLTPYVDSRLIEHIDQLGRQAEAATPTIIEETAYIGDTAIVFTNVPQGVLSVCMTDGTNYPAYTVRRDGGIVEVSFDPLETVHKVTLSIL